MKTKILLIIIALTLIIGFLAWPLVFNTGKAISNSEIGIPENPSSPSDEVPAGAKESIITITASQA